MSHDWIDPRRHDLQVMFRNSIGEAGQRFSALLVDFHEGRPFFFETERHARALAAACAVIRDSGERRLARRRCALTSILPRKKGELAAPVEALREE